MTVMKMAFHKIVDVPLERVYQAMTDFANAPKIIPGITRVEMLTPGPVAVGTKFKETRKMFGKESTETMEVVALEPNRRVALGAESCGVRFRSDFTFSPEGSGTRIDFEMNAQNVSTMARIIGPIMGWMMKSAMRRCIMSDLDAMAKALSKSVASS
jgi:carbon monoxide dehydrogenase subunit G